MSRAAQDRHLQRALRDIVGLCALPASWKGQAPRQIAEGLLDWLCHVLGAPAAYVRLPFGPAPEETLELARDTDGADFISGVRAAAQALLSELAQPTVTVLPARGGHPELRVALCPVGVQDHTGLLAAALYRQDFPSEIDQLLLSAAANQAAIACHIARLLAERKEQGEARQLLAAIVESSEDAIVAKDLNGIITSWNKGAQRMFGYTAAEAIGRPISMLIPPDHKDEMPEILARLKRGERLEHFETVRVTKSGERIIVSLTISPVRDSSGSVVGASKIARNVTESKRGEEALRASEKLAATGRLAAAIAHEINNPLEAVTNLLYILQKLPQLDGEARRYVDLAQEELARVVHIARQTLGFYRDSALPVSISVSELIENLLEVYARKIQGRSIRVERRLDAAAAIQGSPGELRQVFANLLSNALEAVPDGGIIRVHVSSGRDRANPQQRGVRVAIADNGAGIPQEYRQKIFEPFFTTKGERGTGLGLWVTQGIVRKYGGSIRVRSSTRGKRTGTCFSVFFPVQGATVLGFPSPARMRSSA